MKRKHNAYRNGLLMADGSSWEPEFPLPRRVKEDPPTLEPDEAEKELPPTFAQAWSDFWKAWNYFWLLAFEHVKTGLLIVWDAMVWGWDTGWTLLERLAAPPGRLIKRGVIWLMVKATLLLRRYGR